MKSLSTIVRWNGKHELRGTVAQCKRISLSKAFAKRDCRYIKAKQKRHDNVEFRSTHISFLKKQIEMKIFDDEIKHFNGFYSD